MVQQISVTLPLFDYPLEFHVLSQHRQTKDKHKKLCGQLRSNCTLQESQAAHKSNLCRISFILRNFSTNESNLCSYGMEECYK